MAADRGTSRDGWNHQTHPAVELKDLVHGFKGPAALDVGRAAALLKGRRVLAHVLPPHVLERAAAPAVHALGLAPADDDVGERGAVFEYEHGVLLARLRLVLADGGCGVSAFVTAVSFS